MEADDIDGVERIARLAFPDHFEDRACFAERFALYPRGCFVLASERDVAGYLIAYPWIRDTAPPLNSLIHKLPDDADLLYLHDLALHPDLRGQGFTRPVVERLARQAWEDGWRAVALVAVNQAADFWRKLGFEEAGAAGMAEKLASYGPGACYMVRPIPA
jgi:GNAT superfamily N-acetyltransferase